MRNPASASDARHAVTPPSASAQAGLEILRVSAVASDLAESLFWDHAAERLRWIDAWACTIHSCDTATLSSTSVDLTRALRGAPIGSIAARGAGGMVAGVRGGFHLIEPTTQAAHLLAAVEQDRPATNRLNDGKCDRAGRFWCASVNTDHRTSSGALWRLQGDVATLMEDGLIVGNGIAWSPDDRTMYLADTFAETVWAYEFDVASGTIANRRVFVSTAEMSGAVDGATVDADGCYWAALFRGGAVAQFDPAGRLMRRIALPVSDPTICAFGGRDLDTLFVASARRFLDEEQRRAQPLAGHVLAIRGLAAHGVPEPVFRG
jgi:L-arabinonolactonase